MAFIFLKKAEHYFNDFTTVYEVEMKIIKNQYTILQNGDILNLTLFYLEIINITIVETLFIDDTSQHHFLPLMTGYQAQGQQKQQPIPYTQAERQQQLQFQQLQSQNSSLNQINSQLMSELGNQKAAENKADSSDNNTKPAEGSGNQQSSQAIINQLLNPQSGKQPDQPRYSTDRSNLDDAKTKQNDSSFLAAINSQQGMDLVSSPHPITSGPNLLSLLNQPNSQQTSSGQDVP